MVHRKQSFMRSAILYIRSYKPLAQLDKDMYKHGKACTSVPRWYTQDMPRLPQGIIGIYDSRFHIGFVPYHEIITKMRPAYQEMYSSALCCYRTKKKERIFRSSDCLRKQKKKIAHAVLVSRPILHLRHCHLLLRRV